MSVAPAPVLADPRTLLLCLDAMTLASDSAPPDYRSPWAERAARILEQARAGGGRVGHALSRRPGGAAGWRPMPRLAPRPGEAVYHRDEPSAFGNPTFLETVNGRTVTHVLLCGVSLRGSCLATALDAARLGVRLTIIEDAVWMEPRERVGVEAVLRLSGMGLAQSASLRLCASARIGARPHLVLLQGGRG